MRVAGADGVAVAVHRWATGSAERPPVVLQHGFLTDTYGNWVRSGVVAGLLAAGHEVVGVDARGHGASDKPHDPSRFGEPAMAGDLIAVADALGVGRFDLVGYSLGALVCLIVAGRDPRVRRLVLGGLWGSGPEGWTADDRYLRPADLVSALESPERPADAELAAFRAFADAQRADRTALVAQLRRAVDDGPLPVPSVGVPTLVVIGREDARSVRPPALDDLLPGARSHVIPGDHLSAAYRPEFTAAVVEFLDEPSSSTIGRA
jgi:pimeloyl-ACP methyl ester carboxylesterase